LIEGESGSGSGFYLRKNNALFLVTANHVLYNKRGMLRHGVIIVTSYNNEDDQQTNKIRIDLSLVEPMLRDYIDVALIKIGNIPEEDESELFNIHVAEGISSIGVPAKLFVPPASIITKLKDVMVSNDVFILGYPSSLGSSEKSQIQKDRPLLRKGSVAGINRHNSTIILDCPAYFGNSGGMAIELEDVEVGKGVYKVIGVVSEYIPFEEHMHSVELGYTNINSENSGYSVVIPMDTILELIDKPS